MMGMESHVINNVYLFILLLLALSCTYPCSSSSSSSSSRHLCLPKQQDALFRYMHSYNDTMYKWDEHVDCCQWDGILCDDKTGDVISIEIHPSKINGSIKDIIDVLSPLYNLQDLYLEGKNLYRVVPPDLSHFSKLILLRVYSQDQELTMESHSLKVLVQNLTQLEELYLEGVKIYGDISNTLANITTTLKRLNFLDCDLQGIFPESIFHLPNLRYLEMESNLGLMVSLPTFNQTSPLEHLELNPAHISNSMPSSIGNLQRLVYLSLSSFEHEDVIPSSICQLSSLKQLILPCNKFIGTIPQCLGNLINLCDLDLSANQLTGSFPPSLANCTQLGFLNVSDNMINDTISHSLESLPNLLIIDSRANSFHGEIPPWICTNSPYIVDLSNNSFTGIILPCLINYTTSVHKVLNLRMNKLEGTIPDTFSKFSAISTLDLSENRLKRSPPRSMVNCKNLKVLDLGNNSIEDFFSQMVGSSP